MLTDIGLEARISFVMVSKKEDQEAEHWKWLWGDDSLMDTAHELDGVVSLVISGCDDEPC